MSVSVYIDGRPAECREDYNEVIGQFGAVPDESRNRFELWTTQPRGRVTLSAGVAQSSIGQRTSEMPGQSSHDHGGAEDYQLARAYRGAG